MELIAILALALSVYALYQIHELKENKVEKKKEDITEMMNLHEQLSNLVNKRCEIIVKKPMFLIDVAYSFQGKLIDIDDEWVSMVDIKKNKTDEKIIRISLIKNVKEII